MDNYTYGFIGAGNMATSIIKGIITKNICNPHQITVFDIDKNKLINISKLRVNIVDNPKQLVTKSDYIFLAIKPQNFREVINEIKDSISEKNTIISIAAGITTDYILNNIKNKCPIIRAMPNTPLLLSKGATAICKTQNVKDEDFYRIYNIFYSCGTCEIIDENKMDYIVSISGSSPAYIFLMVKAMLEFSISKNIDNKLALNLICQTLEGSAAMLRSSGFTPNELIKMVSSPNGTTIKALESLKNNKFYNSIIFAMEECSNRSKELSKY